VLIALLVGAIQLGITLLRLGDLTRYISHSVIVGFTLGASALLVLDQLKNLLGMKAMGDSHDHFLVRFWRTLTEGGGVHEPTARSASPRSRSCRAALGEARLGWRSSRASDRGRAMAGGRRVRLDAARRRRWSARSRRSCPRSRCRQSSRSMRDSRGRRARDRAARPARGDLDGEGDRGVTGQKLDMNQQCLSEGSRTLGQLLPVHARLGLAHALRDQPAGGRVTQWSGVVSAARSR
jgi:SulP family sulfate permease